MEISATRYESEEFFSRTRGSTCPTTPFAVEVFEPNEHHVSSPSMEIEAEKGIPAGPIVMIWFDVVLQFTVVAASEAEEMPRSTLSLLSEQPVKRAIRATKIQPDLIVENKVLKDIQKRGKNVFTGMVFRNQTLDGAWRPRQEWLVYKSVSSTGYYSAMYLYRETDSLYPGL